MKKAIQALILDYGGVISQPQDRAMLRATLQCSDDDLLETYYQFRAGYDRGQLTGEAYWREVLCHRGLTASDSLIDRLIDQDVQSWSQVEASMIRFIEQSRHRVHKLAIISNMTQNALSYILGHFHWLEHFDECVWSCHIGHSKPGARIYQECLDRLTTPAHQCLFVDDTLANVQGAIEVGMNAIHFASPVQFLSELESSYVLTDGRGTQ